MADTNRSNTNDAADRTEYCEECGRYHERPTWPACRQAEVIDEY